MSNGRNNSYDGLGYLPVQLESLNFLVYLSRLTVTSSIAGVCFTLSRRLPNVTLVLIVYLCMCGHIYCQCNSLKVSLPLVFFGCWRKMLEAEHDKRMVVRLL